MLAKLIIIKYFFNLKILLSRTTTNFDDVNNFPQFLAGQFVDVNGKLSFLIVGHRPVFVVARLTVGVVSVEIEGASR